MNQTKPVLVVLYTVTLLAFCCNIIIPWKEKARNSGEGGAVYGVAVCVRIPGTIAAREARGLAGGPETDTERTQPMVSDGSPSIKMVPPRYIRG